MKKKTLLLVLLIITSLFCFGCWRKPKDPIDIISDLKKIEQYHSQIEIKVKNDVGMTIYKGSQVYLKDYGSLLCLNDNRTFIYKDDKLLIKDKIGGKHYYQDKTIDSVLKLTFIEEYIKLFYVNEEFKYSFQTIKDKSYELIHFIIPGENKNIQNAILYIDLQSKVPTKISILNDEEKETLEVIFTDFNIKRDIDKSIFN